MTRELRLLPLSESVWTQYRMFLKARDARVPTMQPDGVWVGLDDGTLVAGVLLYPTPGEYIFAENMTTNPMAPKKVRHLAVHLLIGAVLQYASMRGKYPMLIIRHRSIARMLQRWGFQPMPGVPWSIFPSPVLGQIKLGPPGGGNRAGRAGDVSRLEQATISKKPVKARKRS